MAIPQNIRAVGKSALSNASTKTNAPMKKIVAEAIKEGVSEAFSNTINRKNQSSPGKTSSGFSYSLSND